jgi:hypothetical protein
MIRPIKLLVSLVFFSAAITYVITDNDQAFKTGVLFGFGSIILQHYEEYEDD